jgi:hypothetical protein
VTLANGISWLVVVLAVAGLVRWIWDRSPLIGTLVLVGVLARATAGAALFWISLRHLPVLPNLQLGNGFWVLALDGVSYYNSASTAAGQGLSTISAYSPSPAYVRLLAVAIRVCGESPLTAVLLNVAACALSCAICVLMWPPQPTGHSRVARAIAVGSLACLPSLLLTSTQPLKDQFFALAVVAAIACIRLVLMAFTAPGPRLLTRAAIGLAGAAAAEYIIGGIRAYYGVMFILATVIVLATVTILQPVRRWAAHIAVTLVVAAVLWTSFAYGAGPYAEPYSRFLSTAASVPRTGSGLASTVAPFESAREAFLASGGATNIVRRHTPGRNRNVERMMDESVGLMALVVPVSILRALSLVDFAGGRGLLAITDLETVFLDLTVAMQLWLVWRRRPERRDVVFLMFTFALAMAVIVPLAYVVTNYGTLFRMRTMYAIPLWLSGAAAACMPARAGEAERGTRRA